MIAFVGLDDDVSTAFGRVLGGLPGAVVAENAAIGIADDLPTVYPSSDVYTRVYAVWHGNSSRKPGE